MKFRLTFVLWIGLAAWAGAGTLPGVRSVKITNTRNDWFYLEELEMLNTAKKDVASTAFGSTATASEGAAFGATVDGAIDDRLGAACCGNGFHSSSSRGNQTYTITFPGPQTLADGVRVWNRQDGCCASRLDGMLFEYFSGPDGGGKLIAAQQVDNLASDSAGAISAEEGAFFALADPDKDTDGDGLTDRYETANGLDPKSAQGKHGATGDLDDDGSTNAEEFQRGTKPNDKDSDADGVLDGEETGTGQWVDAKRRGTNPLVADSDGDSLPDGVETNSGTFASAANTGTDPNKADTDGDGFRDNREIILGSDPTKAASRPAIKVALTGVRSIKVTNLRADWFYLEELEIFNAGDVDVASEKFGAVATASEPGGFGGKAEGPIDDIIGNCCANGFHSSTSGGEQFLIFTFPSPQNLAGEVRVWNRQDGCCGARLDGMKFEYFAGPEGEGALIASQEVLDLAANNPDISAPPGAAFPLVSKAAPAKPLAITRVIRGANPEQISIAWNSQPGETFLVQRSADLKDWKTALESVTAAPAPATETVAVFSDANTSAKTFYRVRRN